MTEFICPNCGHSGLVFPPTTGGAASLCSTFSGMVNHGDRSLTNGDTWIPLLGRLPLDPRLARALDEGVCPFELAEINAATDEQSSKDEFTIRLSES